MQANRTDGGGIPAPLLRAYPDAGPRITILRDESA
jgi:hypothetical protein